MNARPDPAGGPSPTGPGAGPRTADAAMGAPLSDEEAAGRTFEELMADLEAVTDRLASGELGIEVAAALYEQAERLHVLASERLAQVQARVERLAPRSS
jgi:exodeoxyribonuclease VII small subunit